jgi:hypothetical protein
VSVAEQMVHLHADLVHHVLQSLDVTSKQLSVLNSLKAVNKQWLCAVRRVLREHAGSRSMLELFRHDCLHDVSHTHGLSLPIHCRLSPYASTYGLTVMSAVDNAGVLEDCVQAVLWDVCIDAEPCCAYSMWGSSGASCECAWHDDGCPCSWHFEEVLADTYDPGFCLAKLKIKSMCLEVGGRFYDCAKEAMRTQFGEGEIEDAVSRGACAHDSLLLGCMHLGCEFNGRWLSIGMLRVLSRLVNRDNKGILNFVNSVGFY